MKAENSSRMRGMLALTWSIVWLANKAEVRSFMPISMV